MAVITIKSEGARQEETRTSNFQQKTSDLVRNGDYERAWERHCGFLDLTMEESMQIQWRLLEEQFAFASRNRLWETMFPQAATLQDVRQFRSVIPLTDYADYETHLATKPGDILGRPIVAWARTSGRGGEPKWAPYTQEAYLQLGLCALANDFLATASTRGEINVRPNDIMAYNLPPRPYLSGLTIQALGEHFDFRYLPPLDESEKMDFQERNARIFHQAMIEGMQLYGSMTIVAVKVGEQFKRGEQQQKFSLKMLDPRLLGRVIKARARARREGRGYILPRDLWQLHGLMCGGADTSLYRDQIKEYWGVYPHEIYGCTEVGIMAMQAWDHLDMTFIPSSAFYEFIPASAWAAERLQGTPPRETLLMDQLEVGKRYEVVVSNFYGGAFLRYRMHDLVEVTSLGNDRLGIHQPQFRFAGRSGDFIDLSGFAGLIDERQLTTALAASGLGYTDWVVCKEIVGNGPILHLYIEPTQSERSSDQQMAERIDAQLKKLNSDYADLDKMLGLRPLNVTILAGGSFGAYVKTQVARGADMAHLKPARIQPAPEALAMLLSHGAGA